MRVTLTSIARRVLSDVSRARERMDDLHEKLSSGNEINRPSDDPAAVAKIMHLEAAIGENQQYVNNSHEVIEWFEATEAALQDTSDALVRLQELTANGASGSLPQASLDGLAQEVEAIYAHMLDIANSTYNGRYMFSGLQTDTAPLEPDGDYSVQYMGDHSTMSRQINSVSSVQVNVYADEVFMPALDVAGRIAQAMKAGDTEAVGAELSSLEQATDNLLAVRAMVGARMNRAQMNLERLSALDNTLSAMLSETQDADLSSTVLNLKTAEYMYQTALSAGACWIFSGSFSYGSYPYIAAWLRRPLLPPGDAPLLMSACRSAGGSRVEDGVPQFSHKLNVSLCDPDTN